MIIMMVVFVSKVGEIGGWEVAIRVRIYIETMYGWHGGVEAFREKVNVKGQGE